MMGDLELDKQGWFGLVQALLIVAFKITMYHLSQPLAMLLSFYAFSPFMGKVQWYCGIVVCAREILYMIVIGLVPFLCPGAFLFIPFRENNSWKKLIFFTSPQVFFRFMPTT